jgi:plasmid stability protein
MDSLTIHDLDDETDRSLRLRAARNGRTPEEEAREILRGALADPSAQSSGPSLQDVMRDLVARHGAFDIDISSRDGDRDPPDLSG